LTIRGKIKHRGKAMGKTQAQTQVGNKEVVGNVEDFLTEAGYSKTDNRGKIDFALVIEKLKKEGKILQDRKGKKYYVKEYTLQDFLSDVGSQADVVKMLTNSTYFFQYLRKFANRLLVEHKTILKYRKEKLNNGLKKVYILLIKEVKDGKEDKQSN